MAIKIHFGGGIWTDWPIELIQRQPDALDEMQ